MPNTTQHSIRVCTVTETKAVFRERNIVLEIITWTPLHSDFIVSKSLKRDKVSHSDIFRFQDIAYVLIQFYNSFLNGLVYHCREQDEVCSPYSVESVFFKLLTLAPMMPKLVLGIGDFDYWRA